MVHFLFWVITWVINLPFCEDAAPLKSGCSAPSAGNTFGERDVVMPEQTADHRHPDGLLREVRFERVPQNVNAGSFETAAFHVSADLVHISVMEIGCDKSHPRNQLNWEFATHKLIVKNDGI